MFTTTWAQEVGRKECPYLRRWIIDLGLFSVRVHHWLSSDDQRHFHDHPWWYISICLKGGYVDVSPGGEVEIRQGGWTYAPAIHKHTVRVNPGGCWTLLITGPEEREWGFWVNGKFRKRNKYFFEHGHHPCDKGAW